MKKCTKILATFSRQTWYWVEGDGETNRIAPRSWQSNCWIAKESIGKLRHPNSTRLLQLWRWCNGQQWGYPSVFWQLLFLQSQHVSMESGWSTSNDDVSWSEEERREREGCAGREKQSWGGIGSRYLTSSEWEFLKREAKKRKKKKENEKEMGR